MRVREGGGGAEDAHEGARFARRWRDERGSVKKLCPRCGTKPRWGFAGKRVCPECHLHFYAFAKPSPPRKPLARTELRRGSIRVGARAVERRQAGGKRAVGRDGAPVLVWSLTKRQVMQRAGGRCEVRLVGAGGHFERCPDRAMDPCHAVPRSQGGDDSAANIWAGCREHHRMQESDYQRGRLRVMPQGGGRFDFTRVIAKDKFEVRGRHEEVSGERAPSPRARGVATGD